MDLTNKQTSCQVKADFHFNRIVDFFEVISSTLLLRKQLRNTLRYDHYDATEVHGKRP